VSWMPKGLIGILPAKWGVKSTEWKVPDWIARSRFCQIVCDGGHGIPQYPTRGE